MSKELYIAAYDEIRETLIQAGCPEDLAEEIAAEQAYGRMRDQLADLADEVRQRDKDERR